MPRRRAWETWPDSLRRKVMEALAAGKGLREVAKVAGCSHTLIQDYKREVFEPAKKAATKLLPEKPTVSDIATQADEHRELGAATNAVIDAGPLIAAREHRVAALQDYWARLQRVAAERGEDMATVPGGKTGLLCRRIKQVGQGKDAQIVEEYELDGTLLREMREHAKQAAQELGQWEESARPTGGQVAVVVLPVAGLPGPAAPVPQVLPAGAVRFLPLPPGEPADNG
jgi:hypothetical protein